VIPEKSKQKKKSSDSLFRQGRVVAVAAALSVLPLSPLGALDLPGPPTVVEVSTGPGAEVVPWLWKADQETAAYQRLATQDQNTADKTAAGLASTQWVVVGTVSLLAAGAVYLKGSATRKSYREATGESEVQGLHFQLATESVTLVLTAAFGAVALGLGLFPMTGAGSAP